MKKKKEYVFGYKAYDNLNKNKFSLFKFLLAKAFTLSEIASAMMCNKKSINKRNTNKQKAQKKKALVIKNNLERELRQKQQQTKKNMQTKKNFFGGVFHSAIALHYTTTKKILLINATYSSILPAKN